MAKTIYLIHASSVLKADGTPKTWYFATDGYTSKPSDTPANQLYLRVIAQPGLYKQTMYSDGTTYGRSAQYNSEAKLVNIRGELDGMRDYAFDGRPFVLLEGLAGAPLSTFAPVAVGTIQQLVHSWTDITLRLRDRAAELNVPVQPTKYAGDNSLPAGLEGGADLKNKPKPRCFGACKNVTLPCVNTARLIYQGNVGAVTFAAVYDNGVGLAQGADYVSQADMEANPPAAGNFRQWPAGGYARLGSAPTGIVTADLVQGATVAVRTVGQITRTLAVEVVTSADIVEQTIIDLDRSAPYEVGLFTGTSEISVAQCLDLLCQSVGAWWGFDNLGLFWCRQLQAPAASQVITTLTSDQGLSVERVATADSDRGVPVWLVNIDYDKNHTVQTDGVAGSVTPIRREWLSHEYRRTKADNPDVKTIHLLSPDLTIPTLLTAEADGDAEASRIIEMRGTDRDRLKIRVKLAAIRYPAGGYWDDESITEMPTPAQEHAVVLHGHHVYSLGGWNGSAVTAKVYRLDLDNPTGAWDDAGVTDLPIALCHHRAVVHGDYLYVIGGLNSSDMPQTKVYRLDLNNPAGAWDDAGVTDLPASRHDHVAVIHNDYLYVGGGYFSQKTYRLDLNNPAGAWDDAGVSDLPDGATELAVPSMGIQVIGRYLYLLGGLVTDPAKTYRLDLENPAGAWNDSSIADFPAARYDAFSVVYAGAMYVVGGGVVGGDPTPSTFRYRSNSNPNDRHALYSLGRTILVKFPRYGYTSGRPMRIIGTEVDYATRSLLLDVWG